MSEWIDDMDVHDSVDDFVESLTTRKPTIKDVYLRQMGIDRNPGETPAQIVARLRRGSRPIPENRRVWDAHLAKVQRRNFRVAKVRSWLRYLWHPDVVAFAGIAVLLWLAVNAVWQR